jgi:hypothetical protein
MAGSNNDEPRELSSTQKIWAHWHSDLLSQQTLEEHLRLPMLSRKIRKPTSAREALGGIDFYVATGICRAFSVRTLSALWRQYDAAKVTMEEEVFFQKLSSIYFSKEKFQILRKAFEATTMDNAPREPILGVDEDENDDTDFDSDEEKEEEEEEEEEEEDGEADDGEADDGEADDGEADDGEADDGEADDGDDEEKEKEDVLVGEEAKKDEKNKEVTKDMGEKDSEEKESRTVTALSEGTNTTNIEGAQEHEENAKAVDPAENVGATSSLLAPHKIRVGKNGKPISTSNNQRETKSSNEYGRRSSSPSSISKQKKLKHPKQRSKDSTPNLPNIEPANSIDTPETDVCLETKESKEEEKTGIMVLPPTPKTYNEAYEPHRKNAPTNKETPKSPKAIVSNASQSYIDGCTAAFSLPRNKILKSIAPRGKGKTKSTLSIRVLSFKGFFMSDSGFSGLAAALGTRNSTTGKAAMPNLKSLNVADNGLTDHSSICIAQILNSCPRLTNLDLSLNSKLDVNTARVLVEHHILNGSTHSSPKSKRKKDDLPPLISPLSSLSMSACPKLAKEYLLTIRSLMARPKHSRPKFILRELDVSYCKLGDKEGEALSQTIRRWPRAKTLNFGYNFFGPKTGISLSAALQKHKGIDSITASKNNFGDNAGVALAFALAVNVSIRIVELEWCGFGPNTAAAMADALMMSPTIVKLNISHNPIGPEGASQLIKAATAAAKTQAEKSRLAKLKYMQEERDKQEQLGKNGGKKATVATTSKNKQQKYKMKPGAMAVLASVRFEKEEKRNKRLRGDNPIELIIGKIGPTMVNIYLFDAWKSSNSYTFDLSKPGQRYAMEILRQRGLNLGAKLRNCVVDEFNDIRPPSKKNDPCWGNKLPTKGICKCVYVSPGDMVEKKKKDDLKAKKMLEAQKEQPKKLSAKQIKAIELKRIQNQKEEKDKLKLDATLTPRAITYIKELQTDGHLAKNGVTKKDGLLHHISHTALPFLDRLFYKFDMNHTTERAIIHKLLQQSQHLPNSTTAFWKIDNFKVGNKNIRKKKLSYYTIHGIPHPERKEEIEEAVETDFSVSFDLILAHDFARIHVITICLELNLETKEGEHMYRTLYLRQMHHPGEKWWMPTPRNIKAMAALSSHPGAHGLSHKISVPHVNTLKFLYTITTGSNNINGLNSMSTMPPFVPILQRERYTFDLDDELQHHIAIHLLERCEAHQCNQEWISEIYLDEERLPPILAPDLFGVGAGRTHLPMRGTLTLIFVFLQTEPFISSNEFNLLKEEVFAQDRDLDRMTLISKSSSRGLDMEHVAKILQPFLHVTPFVIESINILIIKNSIGSAHVASILKMLTTTLNKHLIQGIARYIQQITSKFREVEMLVPEVVEKISEEEEEKPKKTLKTESTAESKIKLVKKWVHKTCF